ncbi:hypothetical protein RFI_22378, partial [Reticulomyxa filosa]
SSVQLKQIIAKKHIFNVTAFQRYIDTILDQSQLQAVNTHTSLPSSSTTTTTTTTTTTMATTTIDTRHHDVKTNGNVMKKKIPKNYISLSELKMHCIKTLKGHRQRPSSVDWNPITGDLASVARDSLLPQKICHSIEKRVCNDHQIQPFWFVFLFVFVFFLFK